MAKGRKKRGVKGAKPRLDTGFKPSQTKDLQGPPNPSMIDEFQYAFEDELLKPVNIRVDGRSRKVHPAIAMATTLKQMAIKGDLKAIRYYGELTKFEFFSKSQKAQSRFDSRRLLDQFLKDGEDFSKKQSEEKASSDCLNGISSGRCKRREGDAD